MKLKQHQKKFIYSIKRGQWILLGLIFFLLPSAGSAFPLENEQLVYKTNFMWVIPGGKVAMTFKPSNLDNKDIYKVSANYHSPQWLSLFFKLTGEINSFMDKQSYLPIRYEETYSYTKHEGQSNVIVYDQKKGQVYINRNGEKETKSISYPTLDPLSSIYFLRNQIWKKDLTQIYNLNSHQSNYHFEIKCVNEEKVTFNHQALDAWVLEGFLKRNDHLDLPPKAEFTAWISKDDKRLPLKMKLKTKIGFLFLALDRHSD